MKPLSDDLRLRIIEAVDARNARSPIDSESTPPPSPDCSDPVARPQRIMVVETARKFPWTVPDDPIIVAPPNGHHPGGALTLMADGTVRFGKSDTPPAAFRAALTIAGGGVVTAD